MILHHQGRAMEQHRNLVPLLQSDKRNCVTMMTTTTMMIPSWEKTCWGDCPLIAWKPLLPQGDCNWSVFWSFNWFTCWFMDPMAHPSGSGIHRHNQLFVLLIIVWLFSFFCSCCISSKFQSLPLALWFSDYVYISTMDCGNIGIFCWPLKFTKIICDIFLIVMFFCLFVCCYFSLSSSCISSYFFLGLHNLQCHAQ